MVAGGRDRGGAVIQAEDVHVEIRVYIIVLVVVEIILHQISVVQVR